MRSITTKGVRMRYLAAPSHPIVRSRLVQFETRPTSMDPDLQAQEPSGAGVSLSSLNADGW